MTAPPPNPPPTEPPLPPDARLTRAFLPAAPPHWRQVLLRWGLQHGCAVIPKSVNPTRVRDFAPGALLGGDWVLSAAQVAALDALEDNHKFCWDPEGIL